MERDPIRAHIEGLEAHIGAMYEVRHTPWGRRRMYVVYSGGDAVGETSHSVGETPFVMYCGGLGETLYSAGYMPYTAV